MAMMTGPGISPEIPVTTNQHGVPEQPIRLGRDLLGCIKSDWLRPRWSTVFHVDAAALHLQFHLLTIPPLGVVLHLE